MWKGQPTPDTAMASTIPRALRRNIHEISWGDLCSCTVMQGYSLASFRFPCQASPLGSTVVSFDFGLRVFTWPSARGFAVFALRSRLSASFWGSDVAELDLGIQTGPPSESLLTVESSRMSNEEGASTGDARSNITTCTTADVISTVTVYS